LLRVQKRRAEARATVLAARLVRQQALSRELATRLAEVQRSQRRAGPASLGQRVEAAQAALQAAAPPGSNAPQVRRSRRAARPQARAW
jgi:hypothetical protein